jgi:hypothetical protein
VSTTQRDTSATAGSPIGLTDPGYVGVPRTAVERVQSCKADTVARTTLATENVVFVANNLIKCALVCESAAMGAVTVRTGRQPQKPSLEPDAVVVQSLGATHDQVHRILIDVVGMICADRRRSLEFGERDLE